MPIITITTDFGLKDGFVGVLKGVIWTICPEAHIADIAHVITPQNVLEGAFTLWRAYSYFPAGTIHLAVVDPGVGTERRPLAMRVGRYYCVGPDNGLFTPVIEDAEKNGEPLEFVHLTNSKYWLSSISRTFHGRDIFAPVAGHLAKGVSLIEFGNVIHDPVRITMPRPEKTPTGWRAHVTVIDVFGNCTTDLPVAVVAGVKDVVFSLRGHRVQGLVESYGHRKTGDLVALADSEDFIEIAVVNGSAAQKTGCQVGDIVDVFLG